ncbi:glycoside hydrolase superfamily [Tribonema minus]|uniref:Glycoside hydrolase superfamily n=1 Tax=Tribonema minus TaxID=303371 RepID=A0A836CH71_9STRA|nr:glycoside hydrolase superfamily [Tribonema minus]
MVKALRWVLCAIVLAHTAAVEMSFTASNTASSTTDIESSSSAITTTEGRDGTSRKFSGTPTELDHNLLKSRSRGSVQRPTYVGARFAGDDTAFEMQKEWDVQFNTITVYRPIDSVGYKSIRTEGKKLQLVTEMFRSIDDIADGCYDDEVRSLARAIADKGVNVWIRFLHEFNSENTYPWCLYPFTDAKIATFKRAWRRIVSIYREERAPVKFQLCFMAKNPGGDKDRTPFSAFNPGRDYVDAVGVDVYVNAAKHMPSLKEKLNDGIYEQLLWFGKPIFIGEMSVTTKIPDRPQWIFDAWHALALDFPRIKYISWFLECKGDKRPWCLLKQEEIDAFVTGLRNFKELTS